MKLLTQKQRILFLGGLFALIIFVIGAAYAYFTVTTNNNATNSTITGQSKKYGTVSLTTNTSALKMTLGTEMSETNKGKTYYATTSGTPSETNPNYTLATASLTDGDFPLYCSYSFGVTVSVTNEISDGSDENVFITIGNTTKTLKELLTNSTTTISGRINNLVVGTNQAISISSYVTNSLAEQNDLMGNTYTINIAKPTFSCSVNYEMDSNITFAQNLVESGDLWQSGLEDDGYRFTGSGNATASTSPNNFICFGTTDKDTCTANPGTYMYRIIGVFADENGDNHVKLIKYTQLSSTYGWDVSFSDWADSTLYSGLNGSAFLNNTTYIPNGFANMITDWKWTAHNSNAGNLDQTAFAYLTVKDLYLFEMNKSGNSITTGKWATPTAKIGLMYVSDYFLSKGNESLTKTVVGTTNGAYFGEGWMHQSNNDTTASTEEWTMSKADGSGKAWFIPSGGYLAYNSMELSKGIRPVFYLISDVFYVNGTGSLSNPYIVFTHD